MYVLYLTTCMRDVTSPLLAACTAGMTAHSRSINQCSSSLTGIGVGGGGVELSAHADLNTTCSNVFANVIAYVRFKLENNYIYITQFRI